MARQKPDPLWILGFLIVLLIGMSSWHLARQIGQPFEGVLVEGFFFEPYRRVESGTPNWWLASRQDLLQADDRLWSINNVAYTSPDLVETIRNAQGALHIALERQGEWLNVEVPIVYFTFGHFIDLKLFQWLMALSLFLIALPILRAQAHNPLNRRLALVCGLLALGFGTWTPSLYYDHDILSQIFARMGLWLFPCEVMIIIDLIFRWMTPPCDRFGTGLYGLSIFNLGAVVTCLVITYLVEPYSPLYTSAGEMGVQLMFISLALCPILVVGRLIWFIGYGSERVRYFRERRLAKALLLGFGIVLPMPLLLGLGDSYGLKYTLINFDTRVFWLFPGLMLAGAILRYQTFRVHSPVLTLVPMLTFAGLGSSIVNALYQNALPATLEQDLPSLLLPSFIGFLVISIIWASQAQWRMWFASIFYRDQSAFSNLASFSTVLMSYAQVNNPTQAVTTALCEQYGLQSVALWLVHPKQAHSYQLISQMPLNDSPSPTLVQMPAQVTWEPIRLVTDAPDWAHQLAQINHAVALIPLIFEQQLLGWLGVGERTDREILLESDLEALTVVGCQITLFIYATYRRVELEKLNRLLHDTTQQFLYQLGYELPLLEATARKDEERFTNRIKRLKWDVMENSQTLSDILTGKLTRNFDDIEPLLQGFHRDYLPCHWSLDLPQRLDPNLEDEVFFWVKECLNNVWRHARASKVQVELKQNLSTGKLTLKVEDDGIGFQAPLASIDTHHHTGLRRIQGRAIHLGGSFSFESQTLGTCVTICIPFALNSP